MVPTTLVVAEEAVVVSTMGLDSVEAVATLDREVAAIMDPVVATLAPVVVATSGLEVDPETSAPVAAVEAVILVQAVVASDQAAEVVDMGQVVAIMEVATLVVERAMDQEDMEAIWGIIWEEETWAVDSVAAVAA